MRTDVKRRAEVFLFTATVFMGAFLLFSVQPLLAKAVLPQLGGSPSVWNVCMMTYQVLLLCGYAYACAVQRKPKGQGVVQVVMILGALALLPVGIGALDAASPSVNAELIGALLAGAGLPFFLLSAMSPLLQVWYGRLEPRQSPYFLYAVSNLGSLCALISYPFLVEPHLSVARQEDVWSFGFAGYTLLLFICLFISRPAETPESRPAAKTPFARLFYWTALAFAPCSLMMGVTTYVTTDVSPTPLFWIIPLALYLFSYVLAFSPWNRRVLDLVLKMQPAAAVLFIIMFLLSFMPQRLIVPHLFVFYVMSQTCLGLLSESRPEPGRLTVFYFCTAIGGALAGVFNGLVAPLIFSDYFEYAVVFLFALLLRPGSVFKGRSMQDIWRDFAYPLFVFFLSFALFAVAHSSDDFEQELAELLVLAMVGAFMTATRAYPLRYALMGAALVFFGSYVFAPRNPHSFFNARLLQERSFFGVTRVIRHESPLGTQKILFHGRTLHGLQFVSPKLRKIPQTYYAPSSGAGSVFRAFDSESAGWRVGVVGLGTGALSAYALPGQKWTYFEIDSGVAKLSRGMAPVFTYVRDHTPDAEIKIGDGRVLLAREKQPFNLIVLDAFSSDAVPTHLMTREAVALYLKRLTPDGILLFHISNRLLDLDRVLSAAARELGLYGALYISDNPPYGTKTYWAVLTPSAQTLETLRHADAGWRDLPEPRLKNLWTDDYANVTGVVRKGRRSVSRAREEMKKLDF